MMRLTLLFLTFCLCNSVQGQVRKGSLDFIDNIGDTPTYKGCEFLESTEERKICTIDSIRNFVFRNTNQYVNSPTERKRDDVFVRFTVDAFGEINNIKLALPSSSGSLILHQEALRVIKSLPNMLPVIVDDIPVESSMVEVVLFEGKDAEKVDVVEEFPVWVSCTDETNLEAKKKCTNENMQQYLYESAHRLFPSHFRTLNLSETVLCKFYIDKYGNPSGIKVAKTSGYDSLDALAIKILKNMPKMLPGTKQGIPTRFEYEIPVHFK